MVMNPTERAAAQARGRRLRALRQTWQDPRRPQDPLGLSQAKLAAKAGVSPDSIRRLERGLVARPAGLTLARIAHVLGVTAEHLS